MLSGRRETFLPAPAESAAFPRGTWGYADERPLSLVMKGSGVRVPVAVLRDPASPSGLSWSQGSLGKQFGKKNGAACQKAVPPRANRLAPFDIASQEPSGPFPSSAEGSPGERPDGNLTGPSTPPPRPRILGIFSMAKGRTGHTVSPIGQSLATSTRLARGGDSSVAWPLRNPGGVGLRCWPCRFVVVADRRALPPGMDHPVAGAAW